jgi:hypothetical protein
VLEIPVGGRLPEHDHGASEIVLIPFSGSVERAAVVISTFCSLAPPRTQPLEIGAPSQTSVRYPYR